NKPVNVEPLQFHYKDYSAWSNRYLTPENIQLHRTYWNNHLRGVLPESEFPLDFPRAMNKTWRGKNFSYLLDEETSKKIIDMGLANKASFFMVVFAAVKALYFRYTMSTDVMFGTTISSRNNLNLENQI